MIQIIAGAIFIVGYLAIAFEHVLKINKSAVALVIGSLLWLMVSVVSPGSFDSEIIHASSDIFGVIAFLLVAMSLVEILAHYGFFDIVHNRLSEMKITTRWQFVILSLITFFLSAILDNLTTTIVMIQIARQFYKTDNLLKVAASIVISANAGGTFSPIGDVTTIMLWLADKYTALQIIQGAFLPSFIRVLVAIALIVPSIRQEEIELKPHASLQLGRSEKAVMMIAFASFALPIAMGYIGLPPYIGLLLGLGIIWIVVDLFKRIRPKDSHLEAIIDNMIKKTDIPSLKFFIGILLAVAALDSLKVLDIFTTTIYGFNPDSMRIIFGNIGLGFVSAVLDNVPLVAIAIQTLDTTVQSFWILLAITAGAGGSLFIIGSAAGVVAMGMVKELTFVRYLKIAFFPALVSFGVGIGIWYIQYHFLGF